MTAKHSVRLSDERNHPVDLVAYYNVHDAILVIALMVELLSPSFRRLR